MRQVYEQRSANPTETRKVNELEDMMAKQKEYYLKRIKEVENKYRYGGAGKTTTKGLSSGVEGVAEGAEGNSARAGGSAVTHALIEELQ